MLVVLVAVVVVASAAVGLALAMRGGGGADAGAGACRVETFPVQGREHVLALKKGFKYNSIPATSGPHHPDPAVWNVYEQPVDEIHLVHNLEHGGIVVQYGHEVRPKTQTAIVEWYRGDPNGIVVAPLPPKLERMKPELASRIVLTAWQHLATCPRFDEAAFESFRDEYRGEGPERFPVELLEPGAQ